MSLSVNIYLFMHSPYNMKYLSVWCVMVTSVSCSAKVRAQFVAKGSVTTFILFHILGFNNVRRKVTFKGSVGCLCSYYFQTYGGGVNNAPMRKKSQYQQNTRVNTQNRPTTRSYISEC